MAVNISHRAAIALDRMQPNDAQRARRVIERLDGSFPRRKVKEGPQGKPLYIARASPAFRIVYEVDNNGTNVIDIIHHDRMDGFYRILGGGGL